MAWGDDSYLSNGATKGYWKFNGSSLTDSSGNANTLANTGATFTTSSKFGDTALNINTSTNNVYAADSVSLSITGALTINCWCKINTLPVSSNYIVFANKMTAAGNQRSYQFILYNNAGTYIIYPLVSSLGSNASSGSYTMTPDTTKWHLYTMTFTPSTSIKFYYDGVLQYTDTASIPASIYDSTSQCYIGSDIHSCSSYYDDVVIENRAWSANDVMFYYAHATGKFQIN